MKVAFDVSYVQRMRAGFGRYARELLRALFATDTQNEFILHGWSFSLDLAELSRLRQPNVSLRIARIPGMVKRFYWNRLRFPPIEEFVGEFDVFHSSDSFLPPMRKRRGIATVHDLCQKRFPQFFEPRVLRGEQYMLRSLANAAAIIVPSHQTKNDLLEMFRLPEEKVHLVRTPVRPQFCTDSDKLGDEQVRAKYRLQSPFALFVGTIEPRKNILTLIKAFELFHRTGKRGLILVLVGKRGWLYKDIFMAVDHSPVRSRIRYLEYVSDSDLASLYRLAELFVYPSHYEGYGFPILEAMACGTPVVTSNSSSLREIAEGAALLVDPLNTEELAHAIQTLTENPSQRTEFINAGLQRLKQFSPSDAAKEVFHLYQSIV